MNSAEKLSGEANGGGVLKKALIPKIGTEIRVYSLVDVTLDSPHFPFRFTTVTVLLVVSPVVA